MRSRRPALNALAVTVCAASIYAVGRIPLPTGTNPFDGTTAAQGYAMGPALMSVPLAMALLSQSAGLEALGGAKIAALRALWASSAVAVAFLALVPAIRTVGPAASFTATWENWLVVAGATLLLAPFVSPGLAWAGPSLVSLVMLMRGGAAMPFDLVPGDDLGVGIALSAAGLLIHATGWQSTRGAETEAWLRRALD